MHKANNLDIKKHCFFGSEGGVSSGKYSSLNTNTYSLDNQKNILENLNIIASYFSLKMKNIVIQKQTFSDVVNYIEKPSLFELEGDGFVTRNPNLILCIRTADCAPILFEDRENEIIGGCHASWINAIKGIIENTLNVMIEKGAKIENIKAAIGPCLQKNSFDARADMLDKFIKVNSEWKKYFYNFNDNYKFDFETFVYDKINKYGVKNISKSGIDTYSSNSFFSYRKNCHMNLLETPTDYPTQVSTIVL